MPCHRLVHVTANQWWTKGQKASHNLVTFHHLQWFWGGRWLRFVIGFDPVKSFEKKQPESVHPRDVPLLNSRWQCWDGSSSTCPPLLETNLSWLSMICLLLVILIRRNKRKTTHVYVQVNTLPLTLCYCLCSAVTYFPAPLPSSSSSSLFQPTPLLLCLLLLLPTILSLILHCPSLCLLPSCSCVSCAQCLCSLNIHSNIVRDFNSVFNELLLQTGGLCKCLCSGRPGQLAQWQQLLASSSGGNHLKGFSSGQVTRWNHEYLLLFFFFTSGINVDLMQYLFEY